MALYKSKNKVGEENTRDAREINALSCLRQESQVTQRKQRKHYKQAGWLRCFFVFFDNELVPLLWADCATFDANKASETVFVFPDHWDKFIETTFWGPVSLLKVW